MEIEMATINHVRQDVAIANARSVILWETLTATDVGEALALPIGGAQVGVQMIGTFGGAVVLQGTVDGVNWVTLNDIAGTAVSLTAAGYFEISTSVVAVRPSAAAGVSDVDVYLTVV
jgi:hypothetical protein